jgi:hypothetical protein
MALSFFVDAYPYERVRPLRSLGSRSTALSPIKAFNLPFPMWVRPPVSLSSTGGYTGIAVFGKIAT